MKDLSILQRLYIEWRGCPPKSIIRLPGAGSGRIYYRLESDTDSCIGVVGDSKRDCKAFVDLDRCFRTNGIQVPEVFCVDESGMCYLQQDLGNVSLFDFVTKGSGDEMEQLVEDVMRELVKLQTLPEEKWINAVAYPSFDRRQIMWDLNYFKYEYLKPSGVEFDEDALEDDFEKLSSRILAMPYDIYGFMIRDCQSRNVMICDRKIWWIDFQGGRRGPCLYDAISFLWQAKAGFSNEFRNRMLNIYASEFSRIRNIPVAEILSYSDIMALFRTIQVLGAYGFRGLVEKKAHFIESIPGALENLQYLVDKKVLQPYGELERICRQLCKDARFKKRLKTGLRVKVFSFSFKKGYPSDFTGNGGGFMFDCRGMHNPGRYDEYKPLTGIDPEVAKFLEERGEVQPFLKNCLNLVTPTVERYVSRGFADLQVGFGCTGGRHRSVYCASHFAQALSEMFPDVEIELIHREQDLEKFYNRVLK